MSRSIIKKQGSLIKRWQRLGLVTTVTFLLLTGLKAEPAIAELNGKAVTQNINKLIKPTPLPDVMTQKAQTFDAQVAQANKEYADEQAAEQSRLAEQAAQAVQQAVVQVVPQYGGSHTDWMSAAGISPADYQYVDYIVSRESGWNYSATNSSSGAYGLCQSLPAGKMVSAGGDWQTNPITQLRWCNSYAANAHGGGWYNCYLFWLNNHWW